MPASRPTERRRRWRWLASAGAACLVLAACHGLVDVQGGNPRRLLVTQGLVITNATIVDTRSGQLLPDRAIVIDGGRIIHITASREVRTADKVQTIDAAGQYVVPGFLDMHTHALDAIDRRPANWPMLLASGITGIREAGGVPNGIQLARTLNAARAAGRIDAPEVLVTPGDTLSGLSSAALAVQAVQQRKAEGADFVKVTSANREAMLAILDEGQAQGMAVAGHLTPAVSAREASDHGMRSIEHLGAGMGSLLDCSTEEDTIRQALLKGPGDTPPPVPNFSANAAHAALFQRVIDTYSEAKCQALAATFVHNGTWHVPTLMRVRTLLTTDDPVFAADPGNAYADPALRLSWQQAAQRFATSLSPEQRATFRRYDQRQKAFTLLLKRAGVKMMAGSDLSRISTWLVPGLSLHQDFRELAAAGLTPLDVLQMTTLNGAEFLQRQATMGTVEEGKNADLVLLDANPLTDVSHLDRIGGLVLKGRHFSRDALATMRREVAEAQRSAPSAGAARQPERSAAAVAAEVAHADHAD